VKPGRWVIQDQWKWYHATDHILLAIGPLLCVLYMAEPANVIARHGLRCTSMPTTFRFMLTLWMMKPLLQSTILPRVWPMSRPGWETVSLDLTRPIPGYVAGFESTGCYALYHPCAHSLVCKSPGHSPWPRRCHRQPAVTVGSRRCGLLKWLLPAVPAMLDWLVIVWRCE